MSEQDNSSPPVPASIQEITEHIAHRYPFLLIDRVLSIELGETKKIVALKNVTINEPYFEGHFPGNPVMPGVLIIEALAQAAGVLTQYAAKAEGRESGLSYLAKVDKARFNRLVVPGDQLILEVTLNRIMRGMGHFLCEAFVDGKRVSRCELLCAGARA